MNIKNKIDSGIVLKKATKKKEYVHNFNHAVFLTGRAVQELINAEQAHQHIIDFEYGGNYVLKETAELIKFTSIYPLFFIVTFFSMWPISVLRCLPIMKLVKLLNFLQ